MDRPCRILLVKPFQPVSPALCQPPLGLLYLAGALRERFGARVDVEVRDLRLEQIGVESFLAGLAGESWDVVGLSALNFEADVSHQIGAALRQARPETIVVLGGPYPHSSPERARDAVSFDWVFDGEAEDSFPAAVAAAVFGEGDLATVPGLSRRLPDGSWRTTPPGPLPRTLDDLPRPAWDLVPFEAYATRPNMNGWLKGRRYAPLFTSRGCPYKCNYCHDVFGKTFRWRGADDVVDEIACLHERYGVDEFQIIDDIFNLHKPRMRAIARAVIERFGPKQLKFCFPNGIRADILELEDLPLLADMGVYQMAIAIESVTPRLQLLTEKHLKLERIPAVIEAAEAAGILTKGFFMIGFPTETVEEIRATIDFALGSRLSFAGFYLVIPQEGTPIYELARRESEPATEAVRRQDFYNPRPWYQIAYDTDLRAIQKRAFQRFYLHPRRMWRIARAMRPASLLAGFREFLRLAVVMDPVLGRAEPESGLARPARRPAPVAVGRAEGRATV